MEIADSCHCYSVLERLSNSTNSRGPSNSSHSLVGRLGCSLQGTSLASLPRVTSGTPIRPAGKCRTARLEAKCQWPGMHRILEEHIATGKIFEQFIRPPIIRGHTEPRRQRWNIRSRMIVLAIGSMENPSSTILHPNIRAWPVAARNDQA